MRRIITTAFIAVCMLSLFIRPVFGQEPDFTAINLDIPGLGNRGLTGAAPRTGYLNTAINDARGLQANLLSNFNTRDVAVGDFNGDFMQDIIAITADDTNNDGKPDSGTLVL